MILSRKSLLSFFAILPWLFVALGGFTQVDEWGRGCVVLCFSIVTFIIINYVLVKLPRVITSAEQLRNKFHLWSKIFIIFFYLVYIFKLFQFLASFDFNFLVMRDFYFSADSESYNILFNIPALKTLYWYIISPCAIALLICAPAWRREDYILICVFAIANTFEGGRVGLYKLLILYVFFSVKSSRESGKRAGVWLLIGAISIFVLVSISRLGAEDGGGMIFLSQAITSIYDYHTIQLGVLGNAKNLPPAYGPFTGINSMVSALLGAKSDEGALINYLAQVGFYTPDGGGPYNAFATSVVYFVSPFGELGIPFFFISVWITFFLSAIARTSRLRANLAIFMLYSTYFSAFTPFAFGFMWWIMLIGVFIFSLDVQSFQRPRIARATFRSQKKRRSAC